MKRNSSKTYWSQGFTLVEFLVMAFILVSIAGLVAGIIFSVIRSSSNSRTTSSLARNGNAALSSISVTVNDSSAVTRVGAVGSLTDCTANPSGSRIDFLRNDGSTSSLTCTGDVSTDNYYIAVDNASLINLEEVYVVPGSCSFRCMQQHVYERPTIDISFELEAKNRSYDTDELRSSFETSIFLRNYEL